MLHMMTKARVCRNTVCIPCYLVWAEIHCTLTVIACLFSYIGLLVVKEMLKLDAQMVHIFRLCLILKSSD